MLKPRLLLVVVAATVFLNACTEGETGRKAMENYLAGADTITMSEADLANLASEERYVIRKADIRCRVADLEAAVAQLESFIKMADGFVQESHTTNSVISSKSVPYRDDSLKTVQVYRPTADMVIRIPVYALDTLSDEISRIASFIDHRNTTSEDVTLSFISNILKNEQPAAAKTTVPSAAPAEKKEVAARQYDDGKYEQQVDRRIANLSMLDDSRYATLNVQLYQPELVAVFITQDANKMVTAGFGEKIGNALGYGVDIVKGLILVLVTLWPLWISGAVVFAVYKKWLKRTKMTKAQLG